MQPKPLNRSKSLADKLIQMMAAEDPPSNLDSIEKNTFASPNSIPIFTNSQSTAKLPQQAFTYNMGTLDRELGESLARFGCESSSGSSMAGSNSHFKQTLTPNKEAFSNQQCEILTSGRIACLSSTSSRLNSSGPVLLPKTPSRSPFRSESFSQSNKLNLSMCNNNNNNNNNQSQFININLNQTLNNTNNNNSNNNASIIANASNLAVMKVLEKKIGQRSQQIYFLITSTQHLQQSYEQESKDYEKTIQEKKQRIQKLRLELSKLRCDSDSVNQCIQKLNKQTAFTQDIFLLDSSENSLLTFIEATGFVVEPSRKAIAQQIHRSLEGMRLNRATTNNFDNLQSFQTFCEAPFNMISRSLESAIKDVEAMACSRNGLLLQLVYEIKTAKSAKENYCFSKEDLNAHVTRRTEQTAEYEDLNEIYGSFKSNYARVAGTFEEMFQLEKEKESLNMQLDQYKVNISAQIDVYHIHNSEAMQRRSRVTSFQGQIHSKEEEAKQVAHQAICFGQCIATFTQDNFDRSASQFYNYLISIFDISLKLKYLAEKEQFDQENVLFKQVRLICEYQQLLLEETREALSLSSNRTTQFAEEKAKILSGYKAINIQEFDLDLERSFMIANSHVSQWLNLRMCAKNGEKKGTQQPDIMSDFLKLLSESVWNNIEFIRIIESIAKTKEAIQAVDITTTDKQEAILQRIIEDQTKAMTSIADRLKRIETEIDILTTELLKSQMFPDLSSIQTIKDQAKGVYQRISQLDSSRKVTLQALERQRIALETARSAFISSLSHIAHTQKALKEMLAVEITLTNNLIVRFKQFHEQSTQQCFPIELADSLGKEVLEETQVNIDSISRMFLEISPDQLLSSKFSAQESLDKQRNSISSKMTDIAREILLMESQSTGIAHSFDMKISDIRQKLSAARDTLKDQLNKLDLDSNTIFNAFNLNFFDEALLMRQETQNRLPPLPPVLPPTTGQVLISDSKSTQRSAPKFGKITIDMKNLLSSTDSSKTLVTSPPTSIGKENITSNLINSAASGSSNHFESSLKSPLLSSSHQKHILAISQIAKQTFNNNNNNNNNSNNNMNIKSNSINNILNNNNNSSFTSRPKSNSTYNNSRSRNQSNYSGSERIPTLNLSNISNSNSNNNSHSMMNLLLNQQPKQMQNSTNQNNLSLFFGQDFQQIEQPSNFLDTSALNNTTTIYTAPPVSTSRQTDSSFIKHQHSIKAVVTSPHLKRAASMYGQNQIPEQQESIEGDRWFEIYKLYGGHTRESSIVKRQNYDPLILSSDPKSFGYAKKLLRYNRKNQRLEFLKDPSCSSTTLLSSGSSSMSFHSQRPPTDSQSKMVVESSFQKEQITSINIPQLSAQIISAKQVLENKNGSQGDAAGMNSSIEVDQQSLNKLAASKFIPFSFDIEKSGRIQCLAFSHSDIIYLQSLLL